MYSGKSSASAYVSGSVVSGYTHSVPPRQDARDHSAEARPTRSLSLAVPGTQPTVAIVSLGLELSHVALDSSHELSSAGVKEDNDAPSGTLAHGSCAVASAQSPRLGDGSSQPRRTVICAISWHITPITYFKGRNRPSARRRTSSILCPWFQLRPANTRLWAASSSVPTSMNLSRKIRFVCAAIALRMCSASCGVSLACRRKLTALSLNFGSARMKVIYSFGLASTGLILLGCQLEQMVQSYTLSWTLHCGGIRRGLHRGAWGGDTEKWKMKRGREGGNSFDNNNTTSEWR